jgi:hypothetical protein
VLHKLMNHSSEADGARLVLAPAAAVAAVHSFRLLQSTVIVQIVGVLLRPQFRYISCWPGCRCCWGTCLQR